MAELLPDFINTPDSIDFEIDLGFSIINFMSSYRKRFHKSNYTKLKIVMDYNLEEYLAFEVFFTENLRFGTLPFNAYFDLNVGIQEYTLTQDPVIDNFEADLFKVTFEVLQKGTLSSSLCSKTNACAASFLDLLTGIDTSLENNIICSKVTSDAALCSVNLLNLIEGDINGYSKQQVLV